MGKTLFNFDREQVFADSGLNLKVSKKAFHVLRSRHWWISCRQYSISD